MSLFYHFDDILDDDDRAKAQDDFAHYRRTENPSDVNDICEMRSIIIRGYLPVHTYSYD